MKKIITIMLILMVGLFVLGGCTSTNPPETPEESLNNIDLSTPEKTFDIYIGAIKSNDLTLINIISSKKQKNVLGPFYELLQKELDKGNSLSSAYFGVESDALIVKINKENSGYSNIIGTETYNKLYAIVFTIGSKTISSHFVLEDEEWRVVGDWSKYEFEE